MADATGKNTMRSIFINPKIEETRDDLIAELLDELHDQTGLRVSSSLRMFFGAIWLNNDDGSATIKVNYIEEIVHSLFPRRYACYSAEEIIDKLLEGGDCCESNTAYVRAPLPIWLEVYDPMLNRMTAMVQPRYEKLLGSFDEIKSSLYYVVVRLYNKGYYLSNPIIYKTFTNQLNMECRKIKAFQNMASIHDPINDLDSEDGQLTLEDVIEDPEATQWAENTRHMSEEEYDEELLKKVKDICLKMMSPLRYERMLLQIRTKTLTPDVVYDLQKLRVILGSKRFKKEGK